MSLLGIHAREFYPSCGIDKLRDGLIGATTRVNSPHDVPLFFRRFLFSLPSRDHVGRIQQGIKRNNVVLYITIESAPPRSELGRQKSAPQLQPISERGSTGGNNRSSPKWRTKRETAMAAGHCPGHRLTKILTVSPRVLRRVYTRKRVQSLPPS